MTLGSKGHLTLLLPKLGLFVTLLVVMVGLGRFDVEVTLCRSFTDIVIVTVNDTYTLQILITGMPILAQRATLCAVESVD